MAILRFLNNTSLFVAFGALFTYVFGALISHEQIIVTHALNAFLLTWCAYQFIKPVESKFRKIYMIISCTLACLNAFFLPLHFLIPGILGIALTLFYKRDWMGNSTAFAFELRSRGWLKCVSTALAWTLVTSWWMIMRMYENERTLDFMQLVASQFLWIAALALAGDLRDVHVDQATERTLPNRWGMKKTRIVCTLLILVSAALVCSSLENPETGDLLLLTAFHVLAATAIWKISGTGNWHRITFMLDGLLVVRGLVAFLALLV